MRPDQLDDFFGLDFAGEAVAPLRVSDFV